MKRMERREQALRRIWGFASAVSAILLAIVVGGCGGSSLSTTSQTTTQKSPQTYLAPLVAGSTSPRVPDSNAPAVSLQSAQTYMIDDVGDAFSQTSYLLNPPQQNGAQVLNAGTFSTSSRGLLSLGVTAAYYYDTGAIKWESYVPSQSGGFAVQLANQAGGLVQLDGQPVAPLVPTTAACPSIKTAQSYQFITIPGPLIQPGGVKVGSDWDPLSDTAFGSVDIRTSGSTVNFDNIKQFTLASVEGSGAASSTTSIVGACGQTAYGNTISIPGQVVITDPGSGGGPPQAITGIGPTGLLAEDNDGYTSVHVSALGAGTGAVGLPKPSTTLDTGDVVGKQYLGFVYGAGVQNGDPTLTGWSSHLVSFGFSTVPSSCASFAAQSSPLVNGIYGGDFQQKNGQDNPSASPDGFGNCDLAVDLGTEDGTNAGLYRKVKVWVGANYAANTTKTPYSFSAVGIAGQLSGKYAIFILGVDSTQPWAIYLLQSN